MKRIIPLALLVLASGLLAVAKDSAPAQPAEPLIGEMRVATLAPIKFFYVELETSFATLPKDVTPAIDQLMAAAGKAHIKGTLMFRYPMIKDVAGKFTLQVGFPVAPNSVAGDNTKIIDLPAFKCATVNYTGPMKHMKDAYGAVFQAIREEGLKPAGESREAYFYFETPESDNDVTQIQIGVQ